MNFNFGEVLSRAWQIVWKHKVLWIFGILASCSQGGSRFNSGSNGRGNGGGAPGNLPPQMERFVEWVVLHTVSFVAITVSLVCIFAIVAIFLGSIGKIGLIRGVGQVEGGTEHLIFGQLFSESTPYFWRMLGLSLIPAIPSFLLVLLLVGGATAFVISAARSGQVGTFGMLGITIPIVIGCFCLLVPVLWVVGMIFRQAERAIVLEDLPVLPAISRGWDIFKSNLGPILVMSIILAVIGLVAGFIFAIPLLIIVVPAAIAFMAGNAQSFNPLIFALLCVCFYIPVSLVLHGILASYTEAAWTLTFMRLTGKPANNDIVTPDKETPPPPPPTLNDGDKTIISSSHV